MSVADARLIAARGAIAEACLDALPAAQLGEITLRPGQRRIIARAERALRIHGGCLIGEDVGRGKTFIALALARRWRDTLIVAPAGLRSTWAAAQARAGVACGFASHESLSRRRGLSPGFDAIIVDESHHFRNPATARYEELTRMAAAVPIILLSATPLQNRARDLAAQVALFHGERAFQMPAELLARFVIRGEDSERDDMPSVAAPEWLPVDADDGAVLAALLDLPPPPRPLDGGDAGVLRAIALVRAWASSRAALKGMLRSRRRVSTAIAQGVEAGRTPSRRETREWRAAEDVVQLGFAPVLMQQSVEADALDGVRHALDADDAAHECLTATLRSTSDPDRARVATLLALRSTHAGERIIAFSEYASTVRGYFDAMRREPGVGMLTARGARIATGIIPRDELLVRFAPRAQGAAAFAPHDAVTLLLATDLLSEGVNLQDASIVVHLDLPWNPARLSQRVGRVRRPGGAAVVRSFLLAPPAQAEVLLAADARLRRKLDRAREVVGPSFAVLPAPSLCTVNAAGSQQAGGDSAVVEGKLVDLLQRWSDAAPCSGSRGDVKIGAVIHSTPGWLAALHDGRLIASLDGTPTESFERVLLLVDIATQSARCASDDEVPRARAALDAWVATDQLVMDCGVGGDEGPLHRKGGALLANVVSAARRHEQAVFLALASRIRHHLAAPRPLGAERAILQRLEAAAAEPQCAAQTLRHALNALDTVGLSRARHERTEHAPRLVAMIVVGPSEVDDGWARVGRVLTPAEFATA